MSEFCTDWPPMVAAMRRSTARKVAIANDPDAFALDSADDETANSMLRQLLSGTDVELDAVLALSVTLKAGFVTAGRLGVPLESVLAGVIVDAFLVGFWTREAMIP